MHLSFEIMAPTSRSGDSPANEWGFDHVGGGGRGGGVVTNDACTKSIAWIVKFKLQMSKTESSTIVHVLSV